METDWSVVATEMFDGFCKLTDKYTKQRERVPPEEVQNSMQLMQFAALMAIAQQLSRLP